MQQELCIYRDEAYGSNSIPLLIRGGNLTAFKSSGYFAGDGIMIKLNLDENNSIVGVQLGSEISTSFENFLQGMELSPFRFFAVHTFQCEKDFDPAIGGILRFGFLKKIFTLKSFVLGVRNFLSSLVPSFVRSQPKQCADISLYHENYYGSDRWGSYDIQIHKDQQGKWIVSSKSNPNPKELIKELVAKFEVNRLGIVVGIKHMFAN